MMISDADLVAIHRAHDAGGRDAAMAELRRRWLGINDTTAPEVLDRVMAMQEAVSNPITVKAPSRRYGPRHDGPMASGASRKPKAR